MKKVFALSLFASTLVTFAPTAVRAETESTLKPYSYRVKVPAGTTTCEAQAQAIAARFERTTQAKEVYGACQLRQTLMDQGKVYEIDVIVVRYKAELEQSPYRAVFGASSFLGSGRETAGVFASYAECVDAIATQKDPFERETALPLVAGYCTASASEFFPGFSMTLESFGHPKKRLFTFSEDRVSSSDQEDHSQVVAAAAQAITTSGGTIAWSNNARIFYYSLGYLSIIPAHLGTFAQSTQCQSQLAEAKSIFVKGGYLGVSTFCKTRFYNEVPRGYTLLTVGVGLDSVQDDFGARSPKYDSFDECRADLERVIQNADSSGRQVLGGLCSPADFTNGKFVVRIFYSHSYSRHPSR